MTRQQTEAPARSAVAVRFPADFRWGASTSAYQIEGATTEGGRGRSIWDTFARVPGAVSGGDTGDLACDHYRRFRDDVKLMAQLGLTAYRFSVAWPRVQPTGRGLVNQAGLDFYRRLVDTLREHGIEPWATLYHWDLPQPLEDAGGWPERDTAHRFSDYAALVHGALSDQVAGWVTVNEPWCAAFLGYGSGVHAPGRQDRSAAVRAIHHLLLAHGLAVQALRSAAPDVEVGYAPNLYAVWPASQAAADLDAARRIDGLANRIQLDPVLKGRYPDDVLADLAAVTDLRHIREDDLVTIAQPGTFVAVNYYSRYVVAHGADPVLPSSWPGSEHVRFRRSGLPVTDIGWEIDAPGLAATLHRVHRDYTPLPLYVTENGAAYDDRVGTDGRIDDPQRIAYLDAHLRACHQAIADGVPLRGYFVWSLLDNFEWAEGYGKRFGLVHVDYRTQRRTPKASALWYSQVIRAAGLSRQ